MKFAIMALLGLIEAQEDPFSRNITWNEDLNCGTCITGGYNYCFRGKDGSRSKSGNKNKPNK